MYNYTVSSQLALVCLDFIVNRCIHRTYILSMLNAVLLFVIALCNLRQYNNQRSGIAIVSYPDVNVCSLM